MNFCPYQRAIEYACDGLYAGNSDNQYGKDILNDFLHWIRKFSIDYSHEQLKGSPIFNSFLQRRVTLLKTNARNLSTCFFHPFLVI